MNANKDKFKINKSNLELNKLDKAEAEAEAEEEPVAATAMQQQQKKKKNNNSHNNKNNNKNNSNKTSANNNGCTNSTGCNTADRRFCTCWAIFSRMSSGLRKSEDTLKSDGIYPFHYACQQNSGRPAFLLSL